MIFVKCEMFIKYKFKLQLYSTKIIKQNNFTCLIEYISNLRKICIKNLYYLFRESLNQ